MDGQIFPGQLFTTTASTSGWRKQRSRTSPRSCGSS